MHRTVADGRSSVPTKADLPFTPGRELLADVEARPLHRS